VILFTKILVAHVNDVKDNRSVNAQSCRYNLRKKIKEGAER